jgi:hypothetical protein
MTKKNKAPKCECPPREVKAGDTLTNICDKCGGSYPRYLGGFSRCIKKEAPKCKCSCHYDKQNSYYPLCPACKENKGGHCHPKCDCKERGFENCQCFDENKYSLHQCATCLKMVNSGHEEKCHPEAPKCGARPCPDCGNMLVHYQAPIPNICDDCGGVLVRIEKGVYRCVDCAEAPKCGCICHQQDYTPAMCHFCDCSPEAPKCDPESGECAHCGNCGELSKKCTCTICHPEANHAEVS